MKPTAPRCLCPCGAGQNYAACCARFHIGPLHLQAPSAEALIRSRCSAHVLGLGGYLQDTWHASTRPADVPAFDPALRWLGLEVRRYAMRADGSAVVEFVARSKLGGRAQRLHESSRFAMEAGRWFYVDGDVR